MPLHSKFIHLGEDDDGIQLWQWWGETPDPEGGGWVLGRDFVDLGPRFEAATAALAETERGRDQILPFLLGEAGGQTGGERFSATLDELEEGGSRDVSWHDSQQEVIAAGFEAAVVFLLGVDSLLEAEGDPRLDPEARAERAASHTRLLYMAATRAARRLVIFSERRA